MDVHTQQQRGRSPSIGRQPEQRIRHSPSPQPFPDQLSPTDTSSNSLNFTSQAFNPTLSSTSGLSPSYLANNSSQPQFQPHVLPSNDFSDQGLTQTYQQDNFDSGMQHGASPLSTQHSGQQFQPNMLNTNNNNFGGEFTQPGFNDKPSQYFDGVLLDPQLSLNTQQQDQSINPADIMSNMSSPQNIQPTPPNLLPPNAQHSEPTSPFTNPGQQWSPNHSRQASLDPQAAFTNGNQSSQPEWNMMQGPQFQRHRRAPSEHSDLGHSDVSSSVAPSPFMAQPDNFDNFDQQASPMMRPQQENQTYDGSLGIESFTLSDPQNQRNSPRHSPFVSPMMSPQPGLGAAQDSNFMLQPEMQNNFNNGGSPRDTFPNPTEQFPQFPPEARLGSNDYGQADAMAPPEINVEFAGPQPSVMERPRYESEFDALSPPDRSKKHLSPKLHGILTQHAGRRGRMRAKSDTYISRPVTPSSTTATLGSNDGSVEQRGRSGSLSPFDINPLSPNYSRESSPGARSASQQRRSSTNSIPNRDYILELADPSRPSAPGTEKRVQKHPATFQCHLCPKKFTRAYNLRSHLRTHTDERPFVCNVCSKAFARQHDRKRHEGLHSGEKKFVCRGELGTGGNWGCGRRFARADALGRHFRSEAGRVCIKPLLDEEAMERQRNMDEQMMGHQMSIGGLAPQAPMNGGGFTLPAALLAQYPALQGLQWDQISGGPEEGDISGRSSFDASSGGDYFEEDEEGSGYMSDNPMNPGFDTGTAYMGGNQGWKSDNET